MGNKKNKKNKRKQAQKNNNFLANVPQSIQVEQVIVQTVSEIISVDTSTPEYVEKRQREPLSKKNPV